MDLLLKHDGHAWLIHTSADTIPDGGMRGAVDANTLYVCHPNGTADITTPTYQGFGSWSVAADMIADMRTFFYDNIDEDIFNDDSGIPRGELLAESVADAHDLYNPDGTLPTWLIDGAEAIVVEWREANGI